MGPYKSVSERLSLALQLVVPPVAIRFANRAPSAIAGPIAPVAAGCVFWGQGAEGAVLTTARNHQFCSVGTYTHNLSDAPETQATELRETLAAMQGLDYVRPEEVASLPVMEESASYVIYCPLTEATEQPQVVLLLARAPQGLVLSEALSRVDGAVPIVMGRPACALIPQVVNSKRSAASLGCCGARVYLDVLSDDVALWALNGKKLEQYVAAIEALAKANATLTHFHQQRRTDIEAGRSPSVAESLSRIPSEC